MEKRILTVLLFGLFLLPTGYGQTGNSDWQPAQGALLDGKTMVKTNVLGWHLRNFTFSAERILTKNWSAVASIGTTPTGKLPYLSLIKQQMGSDGQGQEMIEKLRVNTFSTTIELRYYPGSGYGKGFYLSPYYKYQRFGMKDYAMEYEDDAGEKSEFYLNGNISTNSGGLLIGYQWLLGSQKNIVLDWSIIGVHYGAAQAQFGGRMPDSSPGLSEEDQQELRNMIDDGLRDIPQVKYEANVDARNADITVKGPWALVRTSLSVGFRF